VELLTSPNPFSFNEWEAPGTFPVSRILPLVSLPDSTFECGERTRLMNMMLLLIRGNVHGAGLKPYELV
jgi:hypothetical protein